MSNFDSQPNIEEQYLPNSLPLITLSELKALGEFARCQDIEELLRRSRSNLILGYPLFRTRLKPNKYVDLLLNKKWEIVEFLGIDDPYLYYQQNSRKEKILLHDPWGRAANYPVAPAGLYTSYDGDMSTIESAKPSAAYQGIIGSYVTGCEVHSVSAPYVTLRIEYAGPRGSSGWDFATFHIADPRIHVDGVMPNQPFYNSPIAVSHRWLGETHPDPSGVHFRELMKLCEKMRFLDCQTFFIDYCSLPQAPRTPAEEILFRDELPNCNGYYQESTIILTEETDDYETRAWCMFEMIISSLQDAILNKNAVEGKLKAAFDLARSFVGASRQNFEAMEAFGILPGESISPDQFSDWATEAGGLNLVFDQMKHRSKRSLLFWFRKYDLQATNMADISIIVKLLDELLP